MAKAIKIGYCKHCGQMENMRSALDYVHSRIRIQVWCACGKEPPREVEFGAGEEYYLDVEVKQEAASDDGTNSGDVPQSGEAGAAGDA